MTSPNDDPRPRVWVGHVMMESRDLEATHGFLEAVGVRTVFRGDAMAVLEMRGGTHIVLRQVAEPKDAEVAWDLMVEDLDAMHAEVRDEHGLDPSAIERGRIHDTFRVADKSGLVHRFNSTHVGSRAV